MSTLDPIFLSNQMPMIEKHLQSFSDAAHAELSALLIAEIESNSHSLLERISLGNTLGLLGDSRIDPLQPAMCRIDAGSFRMGTDEAEAPVLAKRFGVPADWFLKSTPCHEVELDAFEIARFPVTEAEYQLFVHDTNYWSLPTHWRDGAPPRYRTNHPVHGIRWQDILLYLEWLAEKSGVQYRVPTEAEWEKAARGGDFRAYPWGNRFDPMRCNTRETGVGQTTPVGIFPGGAATCGALDLAGNVEEFTADLYWPYPGSKFSDSDYGSYRMTRGGSFTLDADLARCDRRHGDAYASPTGFRLARSVAYASV